MCSSCSSSLLLLILYIYIIIIGISRYNRIWHVESWEVGRHKLSRGHLRTSLSRNQGWMNLCIWLVLPWFHLRNTFSFLFNSWSSVVLSFSFLCISCIMRLILELIWGYFLRLLNFSILRLSISLRADFTTSFSASSLSRLSSSRFWISSIYLSLIVFCH